MKKDKCALCDGDPFYSDDGRSQYFTVHDHLWTRVCEEAGLSEDVLICADCFEFKLGRPFDPSSDFLLSPVTFEFMVDRGLEKRFTTGLGKFLTTGYWRKPTKRQLELAQAYGQ